MAYTIDDNRALQETHLPHQAAVVRLADAARAWGLCGVEERKR
jgi:hypothetical protein